MNFESDKLFHVSEEGNIALFTPRPSPSYFENIGGNVVFAISGKLLHNYLFPRNCPRVTYYVGQQTSLSDKENFFEQTSADYIIAIEAFWFERIQQMQLYCYEFSPDGFALLDANAGYYTSCKEITPLSVHPVSNIIAELFKRNIELRIVQELWTLANRVVSSTLSFSLIRMKNAAARVNTST